MQTIFQKAGGIIRVRSLDNIGHLTRREYLMLATKVPWKQKSKKHLTLAEDWLKVFGELERRVLKQNTTSKLINALLFPVPQAAQHLKLIPLGGLS